MRGRIKNAPFLFLSIAMYVQATVLIGLQRRPHLSG